MFYYCKISNSAIGDTRQAAISHVVMITACSSYPLPQLFILEPPMKVTSVGIITWEHPQHEEQLQYWIVGAWIMAVVGAAVPMVVVVGNAVGAKYVTDLETRSIHSHKGHFHKAIQVLK